MRKILFLVTLLALPFCYAQEKIEYIDYQDIMHKVSEHFEKNEFSELHTELDKIHPNDSIYESVLMLKSYYLLQEKKHDEAIKITDKGLDNKDSELRYSFYINKGVAYLRQDKHKEAIDVYNQAIQEFPKNHMLFYNMAVAYEGLKKYNQAIKYYKKAIIINPFYANSHLQLGKICFLEQKISMGLMAINMYLLLNPDSEESFNVLNAVNTSVSKKNEIVPTGVIVDEGEELFEEIDLILTNGIALNDEYKIKNKIEIALTKQNHALFEQLSDFEEEEGFWAQKYVPFYKWVFENNYFDNFVYTTSFSIKNKTFKKIVDKNTSKVKEFIALFYEKWTTIMKENLQLYEGKQQKVTHFFDSYKLEALGVIKDDKTVGNWEIYTSEGRLSGKGAFDKNGNRTGKWVWYAKGGKISDSEYYTQGELDGNYISYYESGIPKVEVSYKDGKKHGVYKKYSKYGALIEKKTYVDNKVEGIYYSYHDIGASAIDYKVTYKNEKLEGPLTRQYANGEIYDEITYQEGKITGVENMYYIDNQLKASYNYIDGILNGDYKTYYPNGNLYEEGIALDGYFHGDWKVYYPDGTQMKTMQYDKGKFSGLYKEYDIDGKLYEQFLYRKGEIIAYTYYDKNGVLIEENKKKNGAFYSKGYTPLGLVTSEGLYDIKGGKKGKWKYYTDGVLTGEGVYTDNKLNGEYLNYYKSGSKKEVSQYKNDSLAGYYTSYYKNEQLEEQGWYKDNKLYGKWVGYYSNGVIKEETFFHKGNRHGTQKNYGVEGKLYQTILYSYGEKVSEKYYRSDESVLEEINYNKLAKDSLEVMQYSHFNDRVHSTTNLLYGVKHGTYTRYYFNGTKEAEGIYFNNKKHGAWNWYHENGQIQETATYVFGKLHGVNEEFHENGKLDTKSSYKYGKLEGVSEIYNQEGVLIRVTEYKNGNIHGTIKFYSPEGKLQLVRYYHNDHLIGYSYYDANKELKPMIPLDNQTGSIKAYFDTGKVSATMEFKNGDFVNDYKRYFYSGQLSSFVQYAKGDYHGKTIHYYADGSIHREMTYVDGELEGVYKNYYKNGQLKEEINYQRGASSGEASYYTNEGKLTKKRVYYNGIIAKETKN